MRDKIFLNTDVILDLLLDRKPHNYFSKKIFALIETNKIAGYNSSLILSNTYYILKKLDSHKKAINAINKIRSILTILSFRDKEIGESINADFKDLEDGIQYFIAVNNSVDFIITRNTKDYKKAVLKVLTPKQYIDIKIIKSNLDNKKRNNDKK